MPIQKVIFSKIWENLDNYNVFHIFASAYSKIEEFIGYLCKFQQYQEIEEYAKKNPAAGHLIVASMFDSKIKDDSIINLVINIIAQAGLCDKVMLQIELQKRNQAHRLTSLK